MSARTQTQRPRRALLRALSAALSAPLAHALIEPPAQRAHAAPPPPASTRQAVSTPPRAAIQSPAATQQPRGDAEVARLVALVRDAQSGDAAALERARRAGFELLGAGRFADAERVFAALLGKQPRHRDTLYGAALALFNLRRLAEAEPLARAAVEESLPTAWAGGGGGGLRDLRDQPAGPEWRRGASDAQTLLGYVLAARGDTAGALAAVREAVRLAPDNFDAQFALGRALYGAGDSVTAAAAFGEAVRLRPSDPQARFFHATALERANETAAAEREYRELVSRAPRDPRGHLGLGVLLTKAGGRAAAEGVESLLRAVSLDPDSYEARAALGRALIRADRHAEAVEHLTRAAALAPDNPEPQFQLAIAYRRLGRAEDAARASAAVRRIHERRRGVNVNNNNDDDRRDEKPDE